MVQPGLPPLHQSRWTVKIVPPAATDPQGWYDAFLQRWRSYLETLASPPPSAPQPLPCPAAIPPPIQADVAMLTPSVASAPVSRRRPAAPATVPSHKRRKSVGTLAPSTGPLPPSSPPPPATPAVVPPAPLNRIRPRSPADPHSPPPRKRQADLRRWLRPPGLDITAVPSGGLHFIGSGDPSAASSSTTRFFGAVQPGHGRAVQGPPT